MSRHDPTNPTPPLGAVIAALLVVAALATLCTMAALVSEMDTVFKVCGVIAMTSLITCLGLIERAAWLDRERARSRRDHPAGRAR